MGEIFKRLKRKLGIMSPSEYFGNNVTHGLTVGMQDIRLSIADYKDKQPYTQRIFAERNIHESLTEKPSDRMFWR